MVMRKLNKNKYKKIVEKIAFTGIKENKKKNKWDGKLSMEVEKEVP